MTMKLRQVLTAAAATLICSATSAQADRVNAVTGEKLDSGLGSLPHFSRWADPRAGRVAVQRLPGESLDSGLGQLPHHRLWTDRSGKNPIGVTVAADAPAKLAQAGN